MLFYKILDQKKQKNKHPPTSQMHTYPVISLKPSYNSVVRGCPGIPETLPRIECQLQIRSNNGLPFTIEKIELMLLTVETLHNHHLHLHHQPNFPSPQHINTSPFVNIDSQSNNLIKRRKDKLEVISIHYKKTLTFKNDNNNKDINKRKQIIGLDIPLTIALPDDIKETNFNDIFGSCYTLFDCKVFYNNNNKSNKDFKTLINIERYSLLPSRSLFPPIEKDVLSPDERFNVKYKIQNPCLSNDDLLKISIIFKPNIKYINEQSQRKKKTLLFNKKIKLKNVSFQINELLEINENIHSSKRSFLTTPSSSAVSPISTSFIPEKTENVLQCLTKEINQVITMNEIILNIDMRIFTKNKLFQNFESSLNEPEFLYKLPKTIKRSTNPALINNDPTMTTFFLQNKNNNIPFQYHTSITTLGKFFNITHRLTIKFKISGGKSFQINQNVTLTQWSKSQLKYINDLIDNERNTAFYAQKFYKNFGGIVKKKLQDHRYILEYPSLPPVVYNYDIQTLNKYKINYDSQGRIPIIE